MSYEKAEPTLNLSAPWITFFNEIEEMFGQDPEIDISIHDEKNTGNPPYIELFIDNEKKYKALQQLLPEEKTFGNVTAYVKLIPSNVANSPKDALFNDAFEGNPVFSEAITIDGVLTNPITYVVFRKEVAQFYNDNAQDPHGLTSTLYQEIAKDIFKKHDGVFYCTNKE